MVLLCGRVKLISGRPVHSVGTPISAALRQTFSELREQVSVQKYNGLLLILSKRPFQ